MSLALKEEVNRFCSPCYMLVSLCHALQVAVRVRAEAYAVEQGLVSVEGVGLGVGNMTLGAGEKEKKNGVEDEKSAMLARIDKGLVRAVEAVTGARGTEKGKVLLGQPGGKGDAWGREVEGLRLLCAARADMERQGRGLGWRIMMGWRLEKAVGELVRAFWAGDSMKGVRNW